MSDENEMGLFERLSRLKGEATAGVVSDGETLELIEEQSLPEAPAEAPVETLSMELAFVPPPEDPCICVDDDEEDTPPPPGAVCEDTVVVPATDGDDDIMLANSSILDAGGGDDDVDGSFCEDTISGGEGNDSVFGGRGDDFILGGAGSDFLHGEGGNDTIIGGGGTADQHHVTITFEGAIAGYLNTLGIYVIDPCGEIQLVEFAFDNAQPDPRGELEPGVSTFSFKVPPYAKIGTFIVADGFNLNNGYADLGDGEFSFVNAAGDPAMITDPAPILIHTATDGTVTEIEGPVYHSAGFGDTIGLNPDGEVHLEGYSENDDGTFSFGFEDLPGLGNRDFNDVLFRIDMAGSGATFVNPVFDVKGTFTDADDTANTLLGGSGDDYIVTGSAGDTVSAGSGDDTIYAGPGDTVNGGSGHDILVVKDPTNFKSFTITKTCIDENGKETYDGFIEYKDSSEITEFVCIEKIIPCFTPGTSIATPRGERLVEELREGDKIITRDNGIQEIRWIGKRGLDWAGLAANPHLKPVLIEKGALGNGLPERDIMVSPQHRFLVVNERTQLYFDEHEVLVAAKHLINNRHIRQIDSVGLTYVHFMCDRHQVVLANGAWTETFQPGDYTLGGMGNAQRLELFELFPDLATSKGREDYASARKTLKRHEARLIAS
jgi:hypothetical protein